MNLEVASFRSMAEHEGMGYIRPIPQATESSERVFLVVTATREPFQVFLRIQTETFSSRKLPKP